MTDQQGSNPWSKRVVLLFADDTQNREMTKQVRMFHSAKEAINTYDLEVYLVLSDSIQDLDGNTIDDLNPAKIRNDYDVRPDEFRYILVEKDGTVKMNESYTVENDTLFGSIGMM